MVGTILGNKETQRAWKGARRWEPERQQEGHQQVSHLRRDGYSNRSRFGGLIFWWIATSLCSTFVGAIQPELDYSEGADRNVRWWSQQRCEIGAICPAKSAEPKKESDSESRAPRRGLEKKAVTNDRFPRTNEEAIDAGAREVQERTGRVGTATRCSEGVPAEIGKRRGSRRDRKLLGHNRCQPSWFVGHRTRKWHSGQGAGADEGASGEGRGCGSCQPTTTADCNDYEPRRIHILPISCDPKPRTSVTQKMVTAAANASGGTIQETEEGCAGRRWERGGRKWNSGDDSSRRHGMITWNGRFELVGTLENSLYGSGSPECTDELVVLPFIVDESIQSYERTEEGCTSYERLQCNVRWCTWQALRERKGLIDCGRVGGSSHFGNYSTDHAEVHDTRMIHLAWMLKIFMDYTQVIYYCLWLLRGLWAITGRITFLWGERRTSRTTVQDFGWQVARVIAIIGGCLIKIAVQSARMRKRTRCRVGNHHNFRRPKHIQCGRYKTAIALVMLIGNQNLVAAAQHGMAQDYDIVEENVGWKTPSDEMALTQISLALTWSQLAQGSFTDQFLHRAWVLTPEGEATMAGDLDPEYLRVRWEALRVQHGLERPVDVATYVIRSLPGVSTSACFQFGVARFDDPDSLIASIEHAFPGHAGAQWRLCQVNPAIRDTRTGDPEWIHFLLLDQEEATENILQPGIFEFVTTYEEDEHSFEFAGWLPPRTTWSEFSNWCHFDVAFVGDWSFHVTADGEEHLQQHGPLQIGRGFFIQVNFQTEQEDNYQGLPRRHRERWADLFRRLPAGTEGQVYVVSADRPFAMDYLPVEGRLGAIRQRWPWLDGGPIFHLHIAAPLGMPPWRLHPGPALIQHRPVAGQVCILGRVLDGISSKEIAFTSWTRSTVFAIHTSLQCNLRCVEPGIECITRHNSRLCYHGQVLFLQNGDYVEVTVAQETRNKAEETVQQTEENEPSSSRTHQRLPVSIGYGPIHNMDFARLPPPGNGVNLETLDDYIPIAGHHLVVDYIAETVIEDTSEDVRSAPQEEKPPLSGVDFPPEVALTFQHLFHGTCRTMDLGALPELEWHEATVQMLQLRASRADMPISEDVFIYTDGSAGTFYKQESYEYIPWASWAFSIWWKQADGDCLLAYDSGHVESDPHSPLWAGAEQLTSAEGERAALIAATICLLRSGLRGRIHYCFDAMAAGYGGAGIWATTPGSKDGSLLRSMLQLLQEIQPYPPQYEHIKAHQGEPYNEFVNTLAYHSYKMVKINPVVDFEVKATLHGRRPACEYWILLWCAAQGRHAFPQFDTHRLSWQRDFTVPRAEVVWQDLRVPYAAQTHHLNLRVATFNVRSLQLKGERFAGMTAYLRRQCVDRKIDIVCLQETRVRESQIIYSQDYVRFTAAGDTQGQGGTEIWISRHQNQLSSPLLQKKNYLVRYHDSESLVLQLHVYGSELFVISAHAPHGGTKDKLEIWWDNFDRMMGRIIGTGHAILGIDANVHFSFPVEGIVGDKDLEKTQSSSAVHFETLLRNQDMWLPSTFKECHWGPSATWCHTAYGSWHRNDYIAITNSLQCRQVSTWIDGSLDVGGSNIDHLALIGEFECVLYGAKKQTQGHPKINLAALREADCTKLWTAIDGLPDIPWATNVHEHAATLTRNLKEILSQTFPASQRPPQREYISARAWDIRGERNRVRRQLYKRHQMRRACEMRAAFQAWRAGRRLSDVLGSRRMWDIRCELATMTDRLQLRKLNASLKQCLADDRKQYCEEVSRAANKETPAYVIRKLRAIGVSGRKKRFAQQALTPMQDESGREMDSLEALNALWRRHFEQLEDGYTVPPDTLLQRCYESQCRRDAPLPFWNEIPTLHDLEQSLRQNQFGKSSLFDGLPPDACHRFANVVARAFYPLFVKQTLTINEPLPFKGGVLIHAFKGKGAAGSCSSYRALMVSSVLAKAAHRILRKDLMTTFQDHALPLQVGGLPGRAVGQGAQCLWNFSSMCKQQRLSAAILFVDIRQAFYRLIRSHVVTIDTLDDNVARLFRTLHLPDETFAEFAATVETSTAVQDAEVSPFLSAHLTESLLHTWFQLPSDDKISQTRKGSRPGDNLADLLFSFAFRKILHSVMEELYVHWRSTCHSSPSLTATRIPTSRTTTMRSSLTRWDLSGRTIWRY